MRQIRLDALLAFILISATWTSPLLADNLVCEQSFFGPDHLNFGDAYRVSGEIGQRVFFQTLAAGCSRLSSRCVQKEKAYVTVGDYVIAGPNCDGYRLSFASIPNGYQTISFLPVSSLRPVQQTQITPDFLIGNWENATNDAYIAVRRSVDHLTATGYVQSGSYEGDFDGTAIITDNGQLAVLHSDPKEGIQSCKVSATRRGPYLLVNATHECSGAAVSFNLGAYIRSTFKKVK